MKGKRAALSMPRRRRRMATRDVLPKVEGMTAAAEVALRAAETRGRVLLQHLRGRVRRGDRRAAVFQRVRTSAGSRRARTRACSRCSCGRFWSASPPTIFGDGEQSRDFTFVEDVAELNLKAARAPNVAGRMYNGGNGGRITLNEAWRAPAADRGRRDRAEIRARARGRCPRFAGRHHRGRARARITRRGSVSRRACGAPWSGTGGSDPHNVQHDDGNSIQCTPAIRLSFRSICVRRRSSLSLLPGSKSL